MWVYCSVSVCTRVLVRFGWSGGVSECSLDHVVTSIFNVNVHVYYQHELTAKLDNRQVFILYTVLFETHVLPFCKWKNAYFEESSKRKCFLSYNFGLFTVGFYVILLNKTVTENNIYLTFSLHILG